MTALILGASTILNLVFLSIESPDDAIGDLGWAIALAIVAANAAAFAWLTDPRRGVGHRALLAVCYAGLGQVALLNWLAGGEVTYSSLLVLWVCAGVGSSPPRSGTVFLAAVALAALAPLIYDRSGTDFGARITRDALVSVAAGLLIMALMSTIRRQRLGLVAGREEAYGLARLDALTGLGNRRAFDETLAAEMARTRRAGSPLSVALVDLDDFKAVNDHYGHIEGDRYLREAATALHDSVRAGDRCYRWGGDEFALLLPDTAREEADGVCSRLGSVVKQTCRTSDGRPLGVSYGVAELSDEMDAPGLVTAADLALRGQKQARASAGGKRFVRLDG